MKPAFYASSRIQSAGGALVLPLDGGELVVPAGQIKQIILNANGIKGYMVNETPATVYLQYGDGREYRAFGYDLALFKEAYKLALQGHFIELSSFIRQAGKPRPGRKPRI